MPTPQQKQRRARRRLAAVRIDNASALKGVNPNARGRFDRRERKQIRKAYKPLKKREEAAKAKKQASQYDPLAPLTGKRERRELRAATKLEFGGAERELRQAQANQGQTAANTATYYDDYRQALRESTARIKAADDATVKLQEDRVDTAYGQDSAGVAARDATDAETAKRFGRPVQGSSEGAQAVSAQRSAGNSDVSTLRGQGSSNNKAMELRTATASLAKAQAMARESSKSNRLREEGRDLQEKKGAFKTNLRRELRGDERQWSAIQKEFGLKKQELKLDTKAARADRALERQKLATQRLVARIYAAGDKASARAQIRVAELQLRKGKITKDQMTTVRNIYEGLPEPGQSGAPAGGKNGKGNQPLQTWERDKVSNAVRILNKQNALPRDKSTWMKRMQDEGVPLRLARIAWKRYLASKANPSPGTRPHDSQQP